jgi:hypothetical protein
MAVVRINRERALLLAAVLVAQSLLASEGHAQVHSNADTNSGTEDKVQRLLSDNRTEDTDAVRGVFELGRKAVPTLVEDLRNGLYLERASRALMYLEGPEDRKVLRGLIATEKDPEKKWVMAGFLAGALVEPASREDWDYLRSCVSGYKDESKNYASLSAALALGMNGSSQALQILQTLVSQAQKSSFPNDTIETAEQAIRWSSEKASSGPISTDQGSDSDRIKRTILRHVFFGGSESGNISFEEISFAEDRTRALVPMEVPAKNGNPQGYDIVLRKESGVWKVIGVWYTWAA